ELCAVVPPLTLVSLWREGLGARGIAQNLGAAALIAAGAAAATFWLGTAPQWIALGIGVYAAFSWTQQLARRGPPAERLILRTPALRQAVLGFACLAFTGYGTGFWLAPFFVRVHGANESEVGLVLGGISAVAGWFGVTFGGVLADRWRARHVTGRLRV